MFFLGSFCHGASVLVWPELESAESWGLYMSNKVRGQEHSDGLGTGQDI